MGRKKSKSYLSHTLRDPLSLPMKSQPEGTRKALAYSSSLRPVFTRLLPHFSDLFHCGCDQRKEGHRHWELFSSKNTLHSTLKYYFGVTSWKTGICPKFGIFDVNVFIWWKIISNQDKLRDLIGTWWGLVSVVCVKHLSYSQSLNWTMRKIKLLFYISLSPAKTN